MKQIGDLKVFDKLDFYSSNKAVYDQAKQRLGVLMRFLSAQGVLTALGKEVVSIPSDFTLTDRLVTPAGLALLIKGYERWTFGPGTSDPITISLDDFK
jgi:hypothetical protein